MESGDGGFDLFGDVRESGGAVVGGELDAVVLRRIVRGGEVDGAGGLECAHGIGDGWRRRGLGNHDGRNAGRGQNAGGFGDEGLAQEARVAANEYAVGQRLGLHVGGNSRHSQTDIGHGKFVGHNCAPS